MRSARAGRSFFKSLTEALRTACMVLMLIAGSTVLGHFLAVTRIPMIASEWVVALPVNRHLIMVFIAFIYLLGGSFLFLLNDAEEQITLPSGLAVLDLLRRERRLTGSREGCREGDCGACLVLLGEPAGRALRYRAVNSCLLPVGELAGRHLVTIEGLNPPGLAGPALNAIQQSFVDEGATQCGFCTPGFIVALTGHFLAGP